MLRYIQSPTNLIQLNPLVVAFEQDIDDPTTYTIVDKLILFGFYPTTTTYTAKFVRQEQGMDVEGIAALGVITSSAWRLADESLLVQELSTVTAPWWLMGIVEKQWRTAHSNLMIALRDVLDVL